MGMPESTATGMSAGQSATHLRTSIIECAANRMNVRIHSGVSEGNERRRNAITSDVVTRLWRRLSEAAVGREVRLGWDARGAHAARGQFARPSQSNITGRDSPPTARPLHHPPAHAGARSVAAVSHLTQVRRNVPRTSLQLRGTKRETTSLPTGTSGETFMRNTLFFLSLAAGLAIASASSASAAPINAAAVKEVATTASQIQPVRWRRYRRYGWGWGYTKCYREFVIGPYNCHWFPL